ncbi:MAG: hypothetical protein J2P50_02425 [Hyphomicrobiaceae bacterium]|nr:hypothetical protein [Hyphomicrobiaceae bacterium]
MTEDQLIEYLHGFNTAVIGLDRFTERVGAALPGLRDISPCSAGVDHIDPAILKRHRKRMWWAPGINKVCVSELAVCYVVFTLRPVHVFSRCRRAGHGRGPSASGPTLGPDRGIHGCGHVGKEVVKLCSPTASRSWPATAPASQTSTGSTAWKRSRPRSCGQAPMC